MATYNFIRSGSQFSLEVEGTAVGTWEDVNDVDMDESETAFVVSFKDPYYSCVITADDTVQVDGVTTTDRGDELRDLLAGSVFGAAGGGAASYNVYTALLTQSGTDAPVATVLENSIGTLNWSRYGVGSYILATDNEDLFPLGKTVILTNSGMDVFVAQAERDSDQGVTLFTSDESWAGMDNFNTLCIEIRVYP